MIERVLGLTEPLVALRVLPSEGSGDRAHVFRVRVRLASGEELEVDLQPG